jgi:hypothetical protein
LQVSLIYQQFFFARQEYLEPLFARIENKEIEEGANDRNKLSKASKWIVERLVTENSIGSISINDKNLLDYVTFNILNSL